MRMKPTGVLAAGLAAAVLSGCGSDAGSTQSSVLNLSSTAYITQPPTPTTDPTATTAEPAPGETLPIEQEYVIQPDDTSRIRVTKKCGVTLEALDAANADTPGYSAFFAGLKIVIPAGAIAGCTGAVSSPTTTTPGGDAGSGTQTTTTPATTTTLAGLGDNCKAGEYKIKEGDLPSKVAKNFDVTVAQLDAANVNTKGYKGFVVGITIIIPEKTCGT